MIRPAQAPTPRVGIKMPAGTLIPKVIIVSTALTVRVTRRANMTGDACEGGSRTQRADWFPGLHSSKSL